jgi:ribosomal protein L6P/L9E
MLWNPELTTLYTPDTECLLSLSPVATGPFLWESDDPVTIVLDEFYIPDEELDADGYFFFDSEIHPVVIDSQQFALKETKSFWPFFDFLFVETGPAVMLVSVGTAQRSTRVSKAWKSSRGCFRNIFLYPQITLLNYHFITFRLVGIGFYCEQLNQTSLRLIVSNTHDVILHAPAKISISVLRADAGESQLFVIYGLDYQLLQRYAHKINSLIAFNVYEYKGLVFEGEKRRKLVTKQKQK